MARKELGKLWCKCLRTTGKTVRSQIDARDLAPHAPVTKSESCLCYDNPQHKGEWIYIDQITVAEKRSQM